MRVEKQGIVTASFKDVKQGQAFEWCNCVYIKAEYTCTAVLLNNTDGTTSINAVGLTNGSYAKFDDDDEVTIYENAKVVIE